MRSRRKGWLAAFRDATLFKIVYGWGLRRNETAMLDVGRLRPQPARRRSSAVSARCQVRFGKAKKGQPAAAPDVLTVMGWAVEAVADYAEMSGPSSVTPIIRRSGSPSGAARVWPAEINARFVAYRDALGLPAELTVHC